jgi:Na+-transporting methylmalonyl-CoA/oxaloacetate decarboxylase gamma subunit
MSGLQEAFYIISIVYMGVIFIILIALLVAVIKIRNKVNRITAAIEDKINTVTTIAEKTGEVAAIATGAVARKAKRALGKK